MKARALGDFYIQTDNLTCIFPVTAIKEKVPSSGKDAIHFWVFLISSWNHEDVLYSTRIHKHKYML